MRIENPLLALYRDGVFQSREDFSNSLGGAEREACCLITKSPESRGDSLNTEKLSEYGDAPRGST